MTATRAFSAPLRHTCRPGYLIPAHANTSRLHKATRALTRIQHKGLEQKYFISQEEMLFQDSIPAAGNGMMGTVWVLKLHSGDEAYVGLSYTRQCIMWEIDAEC